MCHLISSIVHDRDSYGFTIRDTALSVMIKSLNTLHILSNVQVIDDKVRESVRLQAELHDKEKKVLRQQRKRCQKVSKELENLKMNHEKHSGAAGHRSSKPKKPSATSAATMASQYSEQDYCYNGIAVLRAGLAELHLQEVSGDTKPP